MSLSILTINIGAAARDRAAALLRWLVDRAADVVVLTETSAGAGTAHLLDRFRAAGYAVVHAPDPGGDRGAALVSRVAIADTPVPEFAGASIPGRVVTAVLDTAPAVTLVGIYVPSRDRSAQKIEKKQGFVTSLLAALDRLPDDARDRLLVGGDYNVITRGHRPPHRGFLPFEFGLIERLEAHGLVDAHACRAPGEQPYSWIGRTGDGYCYDYFHVGRDLAGRIAGCAYLHETRQRRLTDHAAVTLELSLDAVHRLPTADPTSELEPTLF